jgi:hypothetical protein
MLSLDRDDKGKSKKTAKNQFHTSDQIYCMGDVILEQSTTSTVAG